ncbi:hypothetical protein GWK08_11125 [Leptobacterium flavescens]|uniref:Fibronectin type-III domain-containing protein n=1 Tax=Leptobacterium flavescens TaxID=472055 RepID=A0A6P0UL47_9FLAO|nr:fibronectin type III domain-containing protein [Leptobacterium flavescens]NER13995.1 hypothetical protein [Leptobacterium flavescens]
MKYKLLFLISLFVIGVNAQDLHDDANAASVNNEANATTGWGGLAVLASDATDVFHGSFSIRASSSATNGRNADYTFNAVIGETYNITIWAKQGTQSFNPAFANWSGMTGFTNPTPITSTDWTEFNFTVTATTTTPTIRIYCSPFTGGTQGDTVMIDRVSITVASSDTEAPSAVTDLAASNTTATTTDLSWSASTDNVGVTDYQVFQDGNSIGFTGGATTFNVTGLTGNTSYAFTVTARDAAGNTSAAGNTANVTTPPAPDTEAPSAVTDLAATNTTQTTTDLSWSASTDNVGVTDYEVFQDGNSIGLTGGATTFNVTGLTASTAYAFTVTARDAAGNTSAAGNTANVTTLDPPDTEAPSAVTDLAANNTTQTTTDLSWSASTDNVGVTDYEVFQDGNSIGLTGGATTFNVTGLTADTSYAFTVTARDAAGNTSAAGNTANVTTQSSPDTEAPSAVTDLAANNTTQTTTDLSWSASTDNVGVTDYQVFQDGNSIGFTGGATTFNVTGLTADTSYAFTVTARDAAGNNSAAGNTANVTTPPAPDTEAPSAVSDLAANNTTQTTTDLSWSASTDNVGVTDYEVFQDGNSIGLTGGATTFNVTGLTASTSYAFTVTARDAAGNTSAAGNTANVTTSGGGGVTDYTSANSNLPTVDWQARDLMAAGSLGIGTTGVVPGFRLAVAGNVVAEEVRVDLQANWPDYVFENNYNLPTLKEVEEYIRQKGHLKNIPSAKEVEENGIMVGQMNAMLLRKIEELTLYTIQQEKKIKKLEEENKSLKDINKRLLEIEKKLELDKKK